MKNVEHDQARHIRKIANFPPARLLHQEAARIAFVVIAVVRLRQFRLPEPPTERQRSGDRRESTERAAKSSGELFQGHSGLPRL
jgi:hypothetical protein